jgi:hypothetical protein
MSKQEEKTNTKTATAEKTETTKATETQKLAELPKIEDVKKLLDIQIHRWEQLSMKIEHRERFLRTLDRIKEFSAKLKQERDKNNPDQEAFFLKLSSSESYNGRAEISVNNIDIISDFLTFINAKIEMKVAELEKDIIG